MHIVGDGVVFIVLLIFAVLAVCTYNFTPDLEIRI